MLILIHSYAYTHTHSLMRLFCTLTVLNPTAVFQVPAQFSQALCPHFHGPVFLSRPPPPTGGGCARTAVGSGRGEGPAVDHECGPRRPVLGHWGPRAHPTGPPLPWPLGLVCPSRSCPAPAAPPALFAMNRPLCCVSASAGPPLVLHCCNALFCYTVALYCCVTLLSYTGPLCSLLCRFCSI